MDGTQGPQGLALAPAGSVWVKASSRAEEEERRRVDLGGRISRVGGWKVVFRQTGGKSSAPSG